MANLRLLILNLLILLCQSHITLADYILRKPTQHGKHQGIRVITCHKPDPDGWKEDADKYFADHQDKPLNEQIEEYKKEIKKLRKKLHEIELKAEIKPEN